MNIKVHEMKWEWFGAFKVSQTINRLARSISFKFQFYLKGVHEPEKSNRGCIDHAPLNVSAPMNPNSPVTQDVSHALCTITQLQLGAQKGPAIRANIKGVKCSKSLPRDRNKRAVDRGALGAIRMPDNPVKTRRCQYFYFSIAFHRIDDPNRSAHGCISRW